MFAKNDEEKRNRLWEIIITVSTILIICIVAFFLIRMFTSNPLEGKWKYEDNGLLMTVKSGGNVVIEWPEENTDTIITVNMDYNLNKDTKTFTLTTNEAAIRKAAEMTAKELGVEMDCPAEIVCTFSEENQQCLKKACPYHR